MGLGQHIDFPYSTANPRVSAERNADFTRLLSASRPDRTLNDFTDWVLGLFLTGVDLSLETEAREKTTFREICSHVQLKLKCTPKKQIESKPFSY